MSCVMSSGPGRSATGSLRRRLRLPVRLRQEGVEIVAAAAADDDDPTQVGQVGAARRHRRMVEAAERLRGDDNFGFAVPEHEGQFALAEDRHQRIERRANARAGEIEAGEPPPLGNCMATTSLRLTPSRVSPTASRSASPPSRDR